MIERYSREKMRKLFTEETKFQAYLDVELATLDAWVKEGKIPKEDVKTIKDNVTFNVKRIKEIEVETKHDIVAFTRTLSESLGDEKKWVHYGLTSTDVVDTANSVRYKAANEILMKGLKQFHKLLKEKALEYKNTPCIGRTHGIHADITSFGLKWALWYDEFSRHIKRFKEVRSDLETGKISGAVGNFANTPPSVQDHVCRALGIESANISTQILQRDRHGAYMSEIALIGSSLEKIALEIRHLQRTEVREVEEYFHKNQTGSSAMPHKRNPIASENITGCARMLRGYMVSSHENIALWHERDISHSSVERVIFPDAMMLLDYMIHRMHKVLDNLIVYEERMLENIYMTNGVIFSQRVLTLLIEQGISREDAYDMVQPLALDCYKNNTSFQGAVAHDETITSLLPKDKINKAFQIKYFLRNVDTIFKRVGIL